MRYIIVTDEKPTSCNNCPLFGEILNVVESSQCEIVDGCTLINKPIGCNCPLLEDSDYFNNLDTNKDFALFVEEG